MSNKFKQAIALFSELPGIGPRQAARIVMAILNWPKEEVAKLADAVTSLQEGVNLCQSCFNFSEEELCDICAHPQRDQSKICVVEKVTDLQSIEKSGFYRGHYHVLGGAINPVDGMLPRHLKIDALVDRIKHFQELHSNGHPADLEIILATNPTTFGDTTAMYIEELLRPMDIKTSRLAKGLSSGTYLEYADQMTLQNAFKNRK